MRRVFDPDLLSELVSRPTRWKVLYHLRSWAHCVSFVLAHKWWVYLIEGFFVVAGTVGFFVAGEATVANFFGAVSLFGTAWALVTFYRDTRELLRDRYVLEPMDQAVLKSVGPSPAYAGFRREEFDLCGAPCFALVNPAVNALLATAPLPMKMSPDRFALEPDDRHLPPGMMAPQALAPVVLRAALTSGKILFNSPKVRLCSEITEEALAGGGPVMLQRTDYFSGLCSNEMTARRVRRAETGKECFDGLCLMSRDGTLLDFGASFCSNHVGVSTLAFTADGRMIVTRQTATSAQSASLLAPSGSGSADWKDLEQRRGSPFQAFLARAMERELLEECGLPPRAGSVPTRVIGFARLLHRGGKPEFFGVSRLRAPARLKVADKETPFIADVRPEDAGAGDVATLLERLARYEADHRGELSFLLYLHFRFLREALAREPDLLAGLLNAA